MLLEFGVKLIRGHGPGVFGEFANKGIVLNSRGQEGFDEAEFALVVEIKGAMRKIKSNASLTIGKLGDEVVTGVAGSKTVGRNLSGAIDSSGGATVKNELAGHAEVNHEGLTVIEVDDKGFTKTTEASDGATSGCAD